MVALVNCMLIHYYYKESASSMAGYDGRAVTLGGYCTVVLVSLPGYEESSVLAGITTCRDMVPDAYSVRIDTRVVGVTA